MLGDNKNAVINTTIPSSILKKKYYALSYQKVREAISYNVVHFSHIDSNQNFSDLLGHKNNYTGLSNGHMFNQ